MICRVCCLSACSLIVLLTADACPAVERIRASLEKTSAWTGEAVPLIITLYSTGPFSGTAAFDLPDMELTAFISGGSPVVGSEQIDGETWLTQRHELKLYTQQAGIVVVPAFRVRFSAKETFTGPAESLSGQTTELQFESKRPPGAENLGIVVAATAMRFPQAWTPDNSESLQPGDVVERKITCAATGTTAMMLPPVPVDEPDGVRIYVADPVVQDRTARGDSTAERSDTLKDQFAHGGSFTIPDLTLTWWDTGLNELRRETLDGRTIIIEQIPEQTESPAGSTSLTPILIMLFGIGLGVWLLRKPLLSLFTRPDNPESRAAKKLLAACYSGDPQQAYAALLQWKRRVNVSGRGRRLTALLKDECADFEIESAKLTQLVFGTLPAVTAWDGNSLANVFRRTRRLVLRAGRLRHQRLELPELNPR